MSEGGRCHEGHEEAQRMLFLLTKPPQSERTNLCIGLIEQARNAALYLAGDGVYNLIGGSVEALPHCEVFACREDMEARGVRSEVTAISQDQFYSQWVEELMAEGTRVCVL